MGIESVFEKILKEKNLTESFIEHYKSNQTKKVFLFGAGIGVNYCIQFFNKNQIPIEGIVDNYKSGNKYKLREEGEKIIFALDDVKKMYDRDTVLFFISAPSAREEIRQQLLQFYNKNQIFASSYELYCNAIPSFDEQRKYLQNNRDRFIWLYNQLSDDKSKDTLVRVLLGRITGNLDYFDEAFVDRQYYPKDIICFIDQEVIVELGSNDGETLKEFIEYCPNFKRAYCFEPDIRCRESLNQFKQIYGERIKVISKGAWDQEGILNFENNEYTSASSKIVENVDDLHTSMIEVTSVDLEVLEPITFIKMDIEGSELKALQGAYNHIKKEHPKLAICVYHKMEDILDIPFYLNQIMPEYRLYLRHHTISEGSDTVLYACIP